MISERENAVLLSAGFTQREINTQRQKFYNLFRIEPYLEPMRKVGEWVDLTDEQIEACRQEGYLHSGLNAPFDFDRAAGAVLAKAKEQNT